VNVVPVVPDGAVLGVMLALLQVVMK